MNARINSLLSKIHVKIAFRQLHEDFLDYFLEKKINPEISFDSDELDHYSISDFSRIARQLARNNLKVTFHAPYKDLTPASSDRMIKEVVLHRFDQMIRLIPVFNPLTVVFHTGYDLPRYSWPQNEWLENSKTIWRHLNDRVKGLGGQLLLENVYERNPQDMKSLFSQLEDCGAGFCLDVGHASVFSDCSLSEWINKMGPDIRQFHLHDNTRQEDDHLPLGKGAINLSLVVDFLLLNKKDSVVVTLEPYEDLDNWISSSLEYLDYLSKSSW